MLDLRDSGYDGVVPVHLGPLGKYNFLLSPESVKAATVEEASTLSRRFSVPLFETLELDRGLVYEQGSRHKRHKKICVPSFEQARSMEAFVGATRQETGVSSSSSRLRLLSKEKQSTDVTSTSRWMRRAPHRFSILHSLRLVFQRFKDVSRIASISSTASSARTISSNFSRTSRETSGVRTSGVTTGFDFTAGDFTKNCAKTFASLAKNADELRVPCSSLAHICC